MRLGLLSGSLLERNDAGWGSGLFYCSSIWMVAPQDSHIICCQKLSVGLSNILDREGGENLSGSSPKKRTHGTGVA